MSAGRLVALAGLLLLLVGCVEVDQVLKLRDDGSVLLRWRLGLVTALARGPWGKSDEERLAEWQALVPDDAAALVRATVEHGPERTWLVLDADLPDVETYTRFRAAFIERYEAENDRNPMLYPPELRQSGRIVRLAVDVPPREGTPAPGSPAAARSTWRLRFESAWPVAAHDAHRVDPGGALVWELPVAAVLYDGVIASARVEQPGGPGWLWLAALAGIAALVMVGVAGVQMFRKRD